MKILSLLAALLFAISSFSQWGNFGNRVKNQAINKTQDKILNETDNAYDKTYDKTKEGVKEGVKNDKNDKSSNKETSSDNSGDNNSSSNSSTNNSSSSSTSGTSLKSYGKFDFIPGEKVIAMEDFSQDAIGDFPAKWNTNGTAEVVTIDGQTGKWLKLGPETIVYPEFVTNLPENFTVEFMVASTQPFSYYSSAFNFFFAPLVTPSKHYLNWKQYGGAKHNGVLVAIHPESAGSGMVGQKFLVTWDESGTELLNNHAEFPEFNHENRNIVKVSVWRQKTRLRVYVNETKIWDIPKAFSPTAKYNFMGFRADGYHDGANAYFISNIRVAVGAPDTRNKFIETGKYSTTGIKFDVNSDKIKPESYGTLKDFAMVLQENPAVKVRIVGHTDSDGDDASNLSLSKKRSESVKNTLNKEFGIELSRMETDGKGETAPADVNTTPEGKANNRRVEFIKL